MRSGQPLSSGMTGLMHDTLTVEIFTPAPDDPLTGGATGAGSSVTFLSQPCADEDLTATRRVQYQIVNGVAGTIPSSICTTRWFAMPTLTGGQSLAIRVNGSYRPLLRQGPPIDVAGQQKTFQLILGAKEGGR